MTATMRNVFSSRVNMVGHDPETNQLVVQWKRGKTSIYDGVPADLAFQVMNAPSVGQAIHNQIKPKYAHRYQEEGDEDSDSG